MKPIPVSQSRAAENTDLKKPYKSEDDLESQGLLELTDVVENAKPMYAGVFGRVRAEYLSTMLAVQEAERTRAKVERDLKKKKESKVVPKKAVEYLRSSHEIATDYYREIGRVLALDEKCSDITHTDRALEEDMRRIMDILKLDMGLTIVCSAMTVGFLNLPRRSDKHIGKGFIVVTEMEDQSTGSNVESHNAVNQKKYTVHFYEHDLVAAISTSTTDLDIVKDSHILGLYTKREEEYTHKERDDCQRISSSMFGAIAVDDIIAVKHFRQTSSRITTVYEGIMNGSEGFNICEEVFKACECIAVCLTALYNFWKAFCSCFGACDSCCSGEACWKYKETAQRESSTINTKLKTDLDDLVILKKKDLERNCAKNVRNPFKGNSDTLVKGMRTSESDTHVYIGVELFYVDHITKTKELGIILCSPETSPDEVFKLTNLLSRQALQYNHVTLKNCVDYTRGSSFGYRDIDPYALAGGNLTRSKDSLLFGNTGFLSGTGLGLDDAMEEIDVEISVPYTVIAVYLNLVFGFIAFICACIAASEKSENAVLVVFDFFHFILRYFGLSLERNTNATFRRDLAIFVVGLVVAIAVNDSVSADTGSTDTETARRRLVEMSFDIPDVILGNMYDRTLDAPVATPTQAPTLAPTTSAPTCSNCTTASSSSSINFDVDTDTAQEISFVMTVMQAVLSILGAIIAFRDNKVSPDF